MLMSMKKSLFLSLSASQGRLYTHAKKCERVKRLFSWCFKNCSHKLWNRIFLFTIKTSTFEKYNWQKWDGTTGTSPTTRQVLFSTTSSGFTTEQRRRKLITYTIFLLLRFSENSKNWKMPQEESTSWWGPNPESRARIWGGPCCASNMQSGWRTWRMSGRHLATGSGQRSTWGTWQTF